MFSRILVPTDFSDASDAALDYARVLAGTFGASLRVLHVLEIPSALMGPEAYIVDSPAFQAGMFEDAKSRLQHRVTPEDRTRYAASTEIISGTSARSIIGYATERGIDLIVMGTQGRSGLSHLLMGSVAERVVRQAPCPVMTVRQAPASHARVRERLQDEWVPAAV
jgi:nucleotide-binding universal stress UspA family protein